MAIETYEAWLDAMPIDDVRRRIERLQQEIADLRVVERLREARQPAQSEGSSESGSQPSP